MADWETSDALGVKEQPLSEGGANFAEGSFSVFNWKGYPAGGEKPTGPFRLLEGAEYKTARNLANKTMQLFIRITHNLKGFKFTKSSLLNLVVAQQICLTRFS